MPGKILPDSLLQQLMRQGLTDGQIVRHLAENENIVVTRQAISAWRKRRGAEMKEQSPRAVPWDLRPEHRQMEPARVIRLFARRQRGEAISPEDEVRLDKALDYLGDEWVFGYEPSLGFYRVAREPEDGDGIVRRPPATGSSGVARAAH